MVYYIMSSADSNDYLNPSMHTPIAIESIEPRWPNKNWLADHPVLFGKVIRSYSRYLLCSENAYKYTFTLCSQLITYPFVMKFVHKLIISSETFISASSSSSASGKIFWSLNKLIRSSLWTGPPVMKREKFYLHHR